MARGRYEVDHGWLWLPRAATKPTDPCYRIGWYPRTRTLEVWYAGGPNAQARRVALGDLLRGLGITLEDCRQALADRARSGE